MTFITWPDSEDIFRNTWAQIHKRQTCGNNLATHCSKTTLEKMWRTEGEFSNTTNTAK